MRLRCYLMASESIKRWPLKKIGLNFLGFQEPFQVHLGFLKFWRIVDSTTYYKNQNEKCLT